MARQLFIVYEIETDDQPPAGADVSRRPRSFTPIPRGCYFARDADAACIKAGRQLGRPGLFAAVQTSVRKLEFRAATLDDDDISELTKPKKPKW